MADDFEKLVALFAALGAPEPGVWVESQVEEGIPQLHRFLFLRQAWRSIVDDTDHGWIDAQIAASQREADAPFAGIGKALANLLAAGASRDDIGELVRGMQAQLLFDLCYLLEDPMIDDDGARAVGWRLVAADEAGEPTNQTIDGLHESVLETDPTGRAMRPNR